MDGDVQPRAIEPSCPLPFVYSFQFVGWDARAIREADPPHPRVGAQDPQLPESPFRCHDGCRRQHKSPFASQPPTKLELLHDRQIRHPANPHKDFAPHENPLVSQHEPTRLKSQPAFQPRPPHQPCRTPEDFPESTPNHIRFPEAPVDRFNEVPWNPSVRVQHDDHVTRRRRTAGAQLPTTTAWSFKPTGARRFGDRPGRIGTSAIGDDDFMDPVSSPQPPESLGKFFRLVPGGDHDRHGGAPSGRRTGFRGDPRVRLSWQAATLGLPAVRGNPLRFRHEKKPVRHTRIVHRAAR